MRIVTIIPARSGSKGLPNKNILNLLGIPMFAWSIIHAQYYSKKDDLIIVSSDSEEYLEIAERYNAVPFLRSKNLSKDITKTEPVMDEVLNSYIIDNDDIVVLLQPTSPVRRKKTLTEFSKTLMSDNFESALTVCNFHGFLWERINENTINPQYKDRPRRQDMPPTYQETGSIYATTYKKFLQNNNRVSGNIMPIFVDFEESLEVDTLEEFNVIESYMEKYYKKEWKEVL